jgi:hypothetical protein
VRTSLTDTYAWVITPFLRDLSVFADNAVLEYSAQYSIGKPGCNTFFWSPALEQDVAETV